MQVIVAPDSFKDCLDADAVARAIIDGVRLAAPDADIVELPLSDGGEGFSRIAARALAPEARTSSALCPDALGRPHDVTWYTDQRRAFCDAASVIGLERLAPHERDPLQATSQGLGQLLLACIEDGATEIVLGLGGVATNDGGWGALCALGAELRDNHGCPVPPNPALVEKVASVDLSRLDPRLGGVRIDVAADVTSPLCGPNGASAIFGPQKGASADDVTYLDGQLRRLALLSGHSCQQPGDGAAGGLGWALTRFAHANIAPGAELLLDAVGWDQLAADADMLLTGEGSFDSQSSLGKITGTLLASAEEKELPAYVLTGRSDVVDPRVRIINPPDMPAAQAMAQAAHFLTRAASDVVLAHLWR